MFVIPARGTRGIGDLRRGFRTELVRRVAFNVERRSVSIVVNVLGGLGVSFRRGGTLEGWRMGGREVWGL